MQSGRGGVGRGDGDGEAPERPLVAGGRSGVCSGSVSGVIRSGLVMASSGLLAVVALVVAVDEPLVGAAQVTVSQVVRRRLALGPGVVSGCAWWCVVQRA